MSTGTASGVSPEQVIDKWENECARERRANAAPDDLPHPLRPEGPSPMIVHDRADGNPQSAEDTPEDPGTIRRLQYLLADAIRTRETALAELQSAREQLAEANRHWFVDGGDGYCQACGLPESNRARHAPRQAVA